MNNYYGKAWHHIVEQTARNVKNFGGNILMKIYILENEPENYRWLEYSGNWFDFFHGLNLTAKPLGTCEHVIRCKPIRDKKERVLGDYPVFSVPAISQRAKDVLEPYFGDYVEIFPLETGKLGKYYFMHIINALDCLDEAKSDIVYFSDHSGILEIKKTVFNSHLNDENSKIFVLKQDIGGNIYVNEQTKQLIEQSELEGFVFIELSELE